MHSSLNLKSAKCLKIFLGSCGFKNHLETFEEGKIDAELLCIGRAPSVQEVAGFSRLQEASFVSQGCVIVCFIQGICFSSLQGRI